MLKRLAKIAAVVCGILIIIILGVLLFLTSSPGEKFIKGQIEERLSMAFGRSLTIGRLETNLFSRAQIEKLVIGPDTVHHDDSLLQVNHLKIRYSLLRLISGHLELETVQIDTVYISLSRDSLGNFGLIPLDRPPSEPVDTAASATEFSVGSLTISSLNAKFTSQPLSAGLIIGQCAVSIEQRSRNSHDIGIGIDSLIVFHDSLTASADSISIRANLNDSTIILHELMSRMAGMTLNLQGEARIPEFDELNFNLELSGNPDQTVQNLLSHFDLPRIAFRDNIKLAAQINGSPDNPVIASSLEIPDVSINDIGITDVIIESSLSGDTVSIDSMVLECLNGRLTASGKTVIDSTLVTRMALDFKDVSLTRAWELMYDEISPYRGSINGQIDFSGRLSLPETWNTDGSLSISRFSYNKKPLPDLSLSMTSSGGKIALKMNHEKSLLSADISIENKTLSGNFQIAVPEINPLAGFFDQPELFGELSADGVVGGTFENPLISLKAEGEGVRYQNFPVDRLFFKIHYNDSRLTIDTLGVFTKDYQIDPQMPPFNLDSVEGTIEYSMTAAGTLEHPKGRAQGKIRNPVYGNVHFDSAYVVADLDGNQVVLSNLDLFRDTLYLHLSGDYDRSGNSGNLMLLLRQLNLEGDAETANLGSITGNFSLKNESRIELTAEGENIQAKAALDFADLPLNIETLADFGLQFEGTPSDPHASVYLTMRSIKLPRAAVDSLIVVASLDPDKLNIENCDIFKANQSLSMRAAAELHSVPGSMPSFSDSSNIEASLNVDRLEIGDFSELIDSTISLSGLLSARTQWRGSLSEPHLQGWLKLADGNFRFTGDSPPVENIEVDLAFQDSVFDIKSCRAMINYLSASLDGQLVLKNREFLEADLTGRLGELGSLRLSGILSADTVDLYAVTDEVNPRVLLPFIPEIDSLDGLVESELKIKGKTSLPIIEGLISVSGLTATSNKYDKRLKDGLIRISFNRAEVSIDTVFVRVDSGFVSLSGNILHNSKEVTDIDIKVEARRLKYNQPGMFQFNLESAGLNYSRQDEYYLIDGDIELGECRLTAGIKAQSIFPWMRSVEKVEWEPPEIIRRTRLDLRIRESNKLWVDNNLARVRVRAEIGVIGSPLQPNFTGMMKIEEGYLLYLDRRFKVTEGSLFFTDPVKFNPGITLSANTQVTNYERMQATKYTIAISVSGTLEEPRVDLVSEPPLDKANIISLLTFGATRDQLVGSDGDTGNGTGKGLLLDRAARLSGQRVSGYVAGKVGSFLGFDEFTVEGNLFQFGDSWGPQLLASRKLSDRVAITYTTTVGHLNDQAVKLEYQLTPRISIQGQTNRLGRSLVDLKYGIKFK